MFFLQGSITWEANYIGYEKFTSINFLLCSIFFFCKFYRSKFFIPVVTVAFAEDILTDFEGVGVVTDERE